MFNLFKKPSPRPVEPSLDGIELYIRNLPGATELIDNFPRVHWRAVHAAVASYRNHPALDRLWTELAAQWLGVIRSHLGEHYQIYESEHLLLLSARSPRVAASLAKLGDQAYARLERLLHRSAQERGLGKHAVIVLETDAVYYDYISYFYAESERPYGASAGTHILDGYRHTAINGKFMSVDRTLVHELAHDMVWHRPLPRWVNEGLAKSAEDMVKGYRPPLIDARQVRLHRRYWSRFGMNRFWDGRAFSGVSSQRLSYQLAEILFRNLANHRVHGRHLFEFLASAHRDDAGAAACGQCFGRSLSELMEEFLGPGQWGPTVGLPVGGP